MLKGNHLAINGGQPVRDKPWSDNCTLGEAEKRAVIEVIEDGHLSLFEGSYSPDPPFSFWGGPRVQALEEAWCDYYGVKYAVSVNSATSGLYAAIGALGLGYGDDVIVSPYTMSACAVAPLIYGAIPIFADVTLEAASIDPISVEERITERTRAILVVHQLGIPADMDRIMALAQRYDLKVIEDCAQAHGAKYKGQYVGTFGDIGVFSLNVNKTIQTGEGGVCVTDDDELRYRIALIRNHGEAVVERAGYKKITNILGFNYRMTELTAAVAIEQLKQLDELTKIRLELVQYLNDGLANLEGIITPPTGPCDADGKLIDVDSTYYHYTLRIFPDELGITRQDFTNAIKAEGILFFPGAFPLYLQPLYQERIAFKHGYPFSAPENAASSPNYEPGVCPNAELLAFEQLIHNEHVRPPHTLDDMRDIVQAIKKVVEVSGKPLRKQK